MNKIKEFRTDFLFATPNFISGMGSVFNIAGNYFSFNYSASSIEADKKAIESDWGVVGQDFKSATDSLKKELGAF